ncbi:hypothetical protein GCM10027217_23350 [Pseudomaricurvus hydrocarbonicus]
MDDLAALLLPWGMTNGVARLYACLLIQEQPISLDEICAALEISKSTASVSARTLEQSKLVKRHRVKGTKRVLYSAVNDTAATVADHATMQGNLASLLLKNANLSDSDLVINRLQHMADFCLTMQQVMEAAIRERQAE